MFNNLIVSVDVATETLEQDREVKKHEFLTSRLERRWNYNKAATTRARMLLKQLKTRVESIKRKNRYSHFDTKRFSSIIERKQFIDAKLMLSGLEQISKLSTVFSIIATQPPSDASDNLVKFKALMVDALKKHAPAYSYHSYQIYALFMVEKSFLKKNGSLEKAGYTEEFISSVESALHSVEVLIKEMEEKENHIHKLVESIVTVLMGKDANKYKHARRQYQLLCTQWTSILTLAPFQYLNLAVSTLNTMSECY